MHKILAADNRVRCVTVVDQKGEVEVFKCREGVQPILTANEVKEFGKGVALRKDTRERWDVKLGKTEFILAIREKICLLGFYLDGGSIIVSIERVSPLAVVSKVMDILKEYAPKFHREKKETADSASRL